MAAVTDIRFVGYGVPDLHVERAIGRIEKLPTVLGAVTRIRLEQLL